LNFIGLKITREVDFSYSNKLHDKQIYNDEAPYVFIGFG